MTDRAGADRPLPRGRHSLSRTEIAQSQRERLLRAMIDEVSERGYVATTAASVYTRAGVSSRSFYEQFANKQDCFIAAYDDAVTAFVAEVRDSWQAASAGRSRTARFTELIRLYLDGLARDPAFARAALVEIYAVGAPALRRRQDVQARFVELVQDAVGATEPSAGEPSADDWFAVEALVGAITFLVTSRVSLEEYDELAGLLDPLCALADRLFGRSR